MKFEKVLYISLLLALIGSCFVIISILNIYDSNTSLCIAFVCIILANVINIINQTKRKNHCRFEHSV